MATRGSITLIKSDGTIKSIYHHFDSYPEGLGQILRDHYSTEEKIEKMINLGDCSYLDASLDESVFYARDRHEDLHITHGPKDTPLSYVISIQEWNYVFENGEWSVFNDSELPDDRVPLADVFNRWGRVNGRHVPRLSAV
jgi:hypothetical protein